MSKVYVRPHIRRVKNKKDKNNTRNQYFMIYEVSDDAVSIYDPPVLKYKNNTPVFDLEKINKFLNKRGIKGHFGEPYTPYEYEWVGNKKIKYVDLVTKDYWKA